MNKLNANEISLLNHANTVIGNCDIREPHNSFIYHEFNAYWACYGDRSIYVYNPARRAIRSGVTIQQIFKKQYDIFVDNTMMDNVKSLYNHWTKVANKTSNQFPNFVIWPEYTNIVHIMIDDSTCYYYFVSIHDEIKPTKKFFRRFNINKPKTNDFVTYKLNTK